nr:sortase [Sneathiella limimaris]
MIEHAFLQSETLGKPVKPWSWSDAYPVAKIDVPKLGVHRYVLSDANMRNLAFGPSLQKVGDHRVIFAHRDTHFHFLREMALEDRVSFKFAGLPEEKWTIAKFDIVSAGDLSIPEDVGEELILLVTCYPFEGLFEDADQRFVAWLIREENGAVNEVTTS